MIMRKYLIIFLTGTNLLKQGYEINLVTLCKLNKYLKIIYYTNFN